MSFPIKYDRFSPMLHRAIFFNNVRRVIERSLSRFLRLLEVFISSDFFPTQDTSWGSPTVKFRAPERSHILESTL